MGDSTKTLEESVRRRLQALPKAILDQKGWLLYSGLDTLRRGRYYVMGFNPATDPANELLATVPLRESNWSAYTQQCWKHAKDKCLNGPHLKPHQKRVQALIGQLGLRPEEVFATNAIFVESADAQSLTRYRELWKECWPMHQWFLSIVRPEWILCLGNGEDRSAYSLLRKQCSSPEKRRDNANYRNGKVFQGSIEIEGEHRFPIRVLGIPHPSWSDPPPIREKLSEPHP